MERWGEVRQGRGGVRVASLVQVLHTTKVTTPIYFEWKQNYKLGAQLEISLRNSISSFFVLILKAVRQFLAGKRITKAFRTAEIRLFGEFR